MGFQTSQKKSYFKIKDGKFYLSTDKEYETPFNRFTGTLKKLDTKLVDYQGKKFEVLNIDFEDGDDNFQLSINLGDGYASTFLSALKNADLSKPITISPSVFENKAKDSDKIYKNYYLNIWQDDSHIKMYYTAKGEGDKELPKTIWVKVGTKNVSDETSVVEFLKARVEEYNAILNGTAKPSAKSEVAKALTNAASSKKTAGKTSTKKEIEVPADEDDLPF